ncbi:uncharacterized protein N7511_001182, partial [Penicillium nucicola]|uniref:uncharacterized protein n=1 Tax=Penicillium nucicola TaxID=1850975 RepID=UPI002545B98C
MLEAFREALRSRFDVDTLSTEPLLRSVNLQGLFNTLLQITVLDMTRFAYEEALDCMVAYYKVALKRFVDDIATQAVKVKLLGAFPTLFTPMSVFGMSKDLVTQIAGESDESRCLRQQLNKKSWILTTGS